MVLTSAVNDEKARAIIAEVKIQGLLDAEITRSTDFDNNLVASLATEQVNRQNADTKLTNDLAFEVSRAQAAEVVLNTLFRLKKLAQKVPNQNLLQISHKKLPIEKAR